MLPALHVNVVVGFVGHLATTQFASSVTANSLLANGSMYIAHR